MKVKILFVSNEAFSEENSNGRTLMNFVKKTPSDQLAQFYIHGNPNNICDRYYNVTDGDALQAFLHKKKKIIVDKKLKYVEKKGDYSKKKNLKNYVIRNIVWQSYAWWTKKFEVFLKEFEPEIVLLQAGDAPFMYSIARRIAKKCHAKLMMFNTESYVLKKKIYSSSTENDIWHRLLMRSLKKQYTLFMQKCDYCIYSMEALEQAYQSKYSHEGRSSTLYTSSEIINLPNLESNTFKLLYCGNLGVGRDIPLCEIAKALYEVDKRAILEIYGKFPDDYTKNKVCSNINVKYNGFVNYQEIPNLMSEASLLIHCENSDRIENLKYAFSTKIADSIASTRPFLVYASEEYPFMDYIQTNQCAHVARNYIELKDVLKKCIESKEYRYRMSDNAKITALNNHNLDKNCEKFEHILNSVIGIKNDELD